MSIVLASLLSSIIAVSTIPVFEVNVLNATSPGGEIELKINVVKQGIKLLRPVQNDYIILPWSQVHEMEELSKQLETQ